jgi:hypothetical protein
MENAVVPSWTAWEPWVSVFLFCILGFPPVLQDLRDNTVSQFLLVTVVLVWWSLSAVGPESQNRLLAAAVVLVLGAFLLNLLPGRLGEADVIFMAGMASLFSFWPLVLALALGCVGALSAFVWMLRGKRTEVLGYPLPFLPSLYWGGLTISLGGWLF